MPNIETYKERILAVMNEYSKGSDNVWNASEISFLSGTNYYGVRMALAELVEEGKLILSKVGNASYYKVKSQESKKTREIK